MSQAKPNRILAKPQMSRPERSPKDPKTIVCDRITSKLLDAKLIFRATISPRPSFPANKEKLQNELSLLQRELIRK